MAIKLNANLFDKVLKGEKIATTRRGIKTDVTVGPNFFYEPECPSNHILIDVTTVKVIPWRNLFQALGIALEEGYSSCGEFKEAVEEIYGELDLDEPMTYIQFELTR